MESGSTLVFENRRQAGSLLAVRITIPPRERAVVLALNLGGVPIAYEVAIAHDAPLDLYGDLHGFRPPISLSEATVILVDDGSAESSSLQSVASILIKRGAVRLVFASPICSESTLAAARSFFHEVIFIESIPDLLNVSAWFDEFEDVSESEALHLLAVAERRESGAA